MKVRFQYTDFTEWEGPPEEAHSSPTKGVVRMFAIDDFDYTLVFSYEDIYYLYPKDGGWLFGADSPKREFILRPGEEGCNGKELPFRLPGEAVIRHGETVSQEKAVAFGLVKAGGEEITGPKRRVTVETRKDCNA